MFFHSLSSDPPERAMLEVSYSLERLDSTRSPSCGRLSSGDDAFSDPGVFDSD